VVADLANTLFCGDYKDFHPLYSRFRHLKGLIQQDWAKRWKKSKTRGRKGGL
jgi:hypothetical protein